MCFTVDRCKMLFGVYLNTVRDIEQTCMEQRENIDKESSNTIAALCCSVLGDEVGISWCHSQVCRLF